ncbi:MAG: hypothetical protein ACREOC_17820 [Gemmatimonadales bacterium]
MIPLIRTLAALVAGAGLAPDGAAQLPAATTFAAEADSAARWAADSLELTAPQRFAFFQNVDTAVADGMAANPAGGRPAVDSALAQVVKETGRKMRFVRQARVIFSDMFARRANDRGRPPGTEEELWRSPANVAKLIELYRDNPEASDHDMERAMASTFRPD